MINVDISGAPFRCEIIDGSRSLAEGDGLKRACVGETAWFEIDPRGPPIAEAEVSISSPSGTRVPTTGRKTSRGTFRFEYVPTEVGPHKIACKYAETALNGSPFTCQVRVCFSDGTKLHKFDKVVLPSGAALSP